MRLFYNHPVRKDGDYSHLSKNDETGHVTTITQDYWRRSLRDL